MTPEKLFCPSPVLPESSDSGSEIAIMLKECEQAYPPIILSVLIGKVMKTPREYLINGVWTREPPVSKPDETRLIFSKEQFEIVKDIASIWEALFTSEKERPQYPEKIIERITEARLSGEKLTLFVPWGPRIIPTRWQGEETPEEVTLSNLNEILTIFIGNGVNAEILLMPADVYGTEINMVPKEVVRKYFEWLEKKAMALISQVEIRPWSDIRNEDQKLYQKARRVFSKKYGNIQTGPGFLAKKQADAVRWLKAAGQEVTEKLISQKANDYITERLCEALVIETVFRPIKLSVANRNTDTNLDWELPRLYVASPIKPWAM